MGEIKSERTQNLKSLTQNPKNTNLSHILFRVTSVIKIMKIKGVNKHNN